MGIGQAYTRQRLVPRVPDQPHDITNKYIDDMRPGLLIGDALDEGPRRRPEEEVNGSQLNLSKETAYIPIPTSEVDPRDN